MIEKLPPVCISPGPEEKKQIKQFSTKDAVKRSWRRAVWSSVALTIGGIVAAGVLIAILGT